MKSICDVLGLIVDTLTRTIKKAVAVVQDTLISLSYFGWRPSVAYLSGRRRRVSSF